MCLILVAVYFAGTPLPNQVGMQMLVQKVVLMVPTYHLNGIIIVIGFWNIITTNIQTWMPPFVFK